MGWLEALLYLMRHLISMYGYLGVFLVELIASSSILFPIPGFFGTMAAATVLNPFIVGLCAGLGAAIGEFTGYLLGLGGRKIIEDRVKLDHAARLYKRYGLWTIYMFAATPSPFDIIGILCGVLNVDAKIFFLMTLAGKITLRIMLALTGKQSLHIISNLLSGQMNYLDLTFVFLVVCFMLGSLLYWNRVASRTQVADHSNLG